VTKPPRDRSHAGAQEPPVPSPAEGDAPTAPWTSRPWGSGHVFGCGSCPFESTDEDRIREHVRTHNDSRKEC